MSQSTTDLEAYVRQQAPGIAAAIKLVGEKARNEADIVFEIGKILAEFGRNIAGGLDFDLRPEREPTLVNGRADAVYNRFVIEYEPPRSLTRSNVSRNNQHAIEQVKRYIDGLERRDKRRKERLAGVVLDGCYFIFVRYRDGRWFEDEPLLVGDHSTEKFLRYLLSLSTELALTPENLVSGFGERSDVARQVVPALYRALRATENPKAQILFEQRQRQFREVSGYDPQGAQLDTRTLAGLYAVNDATVDVERLFFALHTYYATFIKLLALQVAHYYSRSGSSRSGSSRSGSSRSGSSRSGSSRSGSSRSGSSRAAVPTRGRKVSSITARVRVPVRTPC
jgi:hypothetical protein